MLITVFYTSLEIIPSLWLCYQLSTNLGSFILFYSFNIKSFSLGRKSGISPKKSKYMTPMQQKLNEVYEAVKNYTDKRGRRLSAIFLRLPSRSELPDKVRALYGCSCIIYERETILPSPRVSESGKHFIRVPSVKYLLLSISLESK